MKLSLEQIKAVTVGAVNIYQDEVGFHFKRFTDSQLEIFGAKREQFRIRTNSTAGCQLSFYTDSGMIIIEVVSGVKFEVLVDGLPYHFFLLDGPKKLPISLPCGRKHIVLSLPNYSEGILAGICLDEGSYVEPYTYQKKFLFLGDSITQGSQSTRDSFCYAYRVSRFFDAEILNLGVGGSYMSADTLEDVGFDPDAVFIAYGTNDYTHFDSIVSAETACREYFDKVKELYGNRPIFYISPLWRADGNLVRKTGTLDDCRKVFIRECEAHGFIHIDGYSLVPHVPFYLNDGYLHPSDLGFSFYSENLIKILQNHL